GFESRRGHTHSSDSRFLCASRDITDAPGSSFLFAQAPTPLVRAVAAHADPRLFPLADSHVPRLVDSSRRAHALRCTVAALPPLPCSQPPREQGAPHPISGPHHLQPSTD